MGNWSGKTIDLELEGVRELDVRIVGGELSITSGEGPVTVEAAVERGGDIQVELDDAGVLRINHDRDPSVLGAILGGKATARVSMVISVPTTTPVTVRTVSADTFLAGVAAEVSLSTVSGAITASSLRGGVVAKTVSGVVELQDTDGTMDVTSVSGDITASGTIADRLAVRSVSGDLTLDLDGLGEGNLNTVSGVVAIRLPAEAGVAFDATTVSGHLDCAFQLRDEHSSKRRLRGRVGDGESRLAVRTVSGDVALLRREAVAA